jgi:hypothetical protein
MKKHRKSEAEINIDRQHEQLMQNHKDFFDKVGDKRVGDLTMDEWKYFATALISEIGETATKEKK